jgi:hypothetical protein
MVDDTGSKSWFNHAVMGVYRNDGPPIVESADAADVRYFQKKLFDALKISQNPPTVDVSESVKELIHLDLQLSKGLKNE